MYGEEVILRLTDRKAWIKSALTEARGFPLTRIVYVSSRSLPISVPNQERFVNSGEDSGVRLTSSPAPTRQRNVERERDRQTDRERKKNRALAIRFDFFVPFWKVEAGWMANIWLQVPIKWKLEGNKPRGRRRTLLQLKIRWDELHIFHIHVTFSLPFLFFSFLRSLENGQFLKSTFFSCVCKECWKSILPCWIHTQIIIQCIKLGLEKLTKSRELRTNPLFLSYLSFSFSFK